MTRFFRFLLALFLLPFCVALPYAVGRLLFLRRTAEFPVEAAAFAGGFALFLVLSLLCPAPARLYVFGHELTHALWGLAFGARVSDIRVGASGGSVSLSKSNVWITLAPYFFPFYTLIVLLLALLVRLFVSPLPFPWFWYFAVGLTWSFHLTLTLRALFQTQPDVQEYGRLFSWSFIWIANLAIVLLALVAATPVTLADVRLELGRASMLTYGVTCAGAKTVFARILSLCRGT